MWKRLAKKLTSSKSASGAQSSPALGLSSKIEVETKTFSESDEALVSRRAYEIWLEEGCPEGCSAEHWARAVKELQGAS